MGALICLLGAAAACLLLGPAAAGLRGWAERLSRARRGIVDRDLPGLFLFVDSRHYAWLVAGAVLAIEAIAMPLTGSPILAALAGLAALGIPRLVARWLRGRRLRRIRLQLPDAAELLAASLRSGLGLVQSMAQLARHVANPLAQELQVVLREHRMGRSLEAALAGFRDRAGGEGADLFVAAVSSGQRLGGNLSEVLARTAHAMRERQAIELKIDALTAQGRMQARIVSVLPVALLLVMTRLQPAAMRLMYTTRPGWLALGSVAVLELSGLLLLGRIARVEA